MQRIFILDVTAPLHKVTVLFLPCLNDFIQTLKRCFLFISLVSSEHVFISNSVIMINHCGVFANYVFFYLCLFPLTYLSPIGYMINGQDHVLPQNELSQNFLFSPVVCNFYRKRCCCQDAHSWVRFIYICFLYIICTYKIT